MTTSLECKNWSVTIKNSRKCSSNQNACDGCEFKEAPKSVVELLNNNQIKDRNNRIADIKESIHKGKAALVLGAGVSVPSGMPMWDELISKLLGYALQYDLLNDCLLHGSTAEERKKFEEPIHLTQGMIDGNLCILGNVNTLESAEYVAQLCCDCNAEKWIQEKLPELSIKSMVSQLISSSDGPQDLIEKEQNKRTERGEEKYTDAELREPENTANMNTMFAVANLMACDNGIHQAVTYNYDPLVQEHLMDLYSIPARSILTHPGRWNEYNDDTPNLRQFYHIHGFVCGNRHLKDCHDTDWERVYPQETGPLVLSEDSYYRIEQREAYNWSSSIQSYFFNKYNCIFVGFSAEDYNFRRILRQMGDTLDGEGNAKTSHPWHYLILTVDGWVKDIYKAVCRAYWKSHKKVKEDASDQIGQDTKYLLQKVLASREQYWVRFGIKPIWVTKDDIPGLLTGFLERSTEET